MSISQKRGRWAERVIAQGLSRRDMIKAMGVVSLAAVGTMGCTSPVISPTPTPTMTATATPTPVPTTADLFVAVDPDPVKLVDKALDAYGSLGSVIKKGDKVFIKANYSFKQPDGHTKPIANNPQVLVRIMQRCKEEGAAEVTAIDHTINNADMCLSSNGIGDAVKAAGFKAIGLPNSWNGYTEVSVPGVSLKKTEIARALDEADVLINAPVIKSHSMTKATGGMKNLMGIVFERNGNFHWPGPLDQCIADLAAYVKPDLTIADAYRVLMTGGPAGGDRNSQVKEANTLIIGHDMVAVDSYAVSLLGLKAQDIGHIMNAYKLGLGEHDLGRLKVMNV